MSRTRALLILLGWAVVIAGCSGPAHRAGSTEWALQAFDTPRTSDPPGTLWIADSEGRWSVGQLDLKPSACTPEDVPYGEATQEFTLEALMRTLTLPPAEFRVSATDLEKTYSVTQRVADPCREALSFDKAFKEAVRRYFEKQPYDRSAKYTIIMETVSGGGIAFTLTEEVIAKLGGRAQVKEIAEPRPNVAVTESDNLSISRDFEGRQRVWFMARELLPDNNGPAEGIPDFRFIPVVLEREPPSSEPAEGP